MNTSSASSSSASQFIILQTKKIINDITEGGSELIEKTRIKNLNLKLISYFRES